MRGRSQALLLAVFSTSTSLFFWVGAAVVALVTLRKGVAEGFIVLLWSCLPAAAVLYYLGEVLPLSNLISAFFLAIVLRYTVSWSLTLSMAALSGLMLGGILVTFAASYLDFLVQVMSELVADIEMNLRQSGEMVTLDRPDGLLISGGLAMMQSAAVCVSLILARYWQAALYNPGGFREEFHDLRLGSRMASLLMLSALYLWSRDDNLAMWSLALLVPLMIGGIGLLHWLFARLRNGRQWLVLVYGSLLLVAPMKFGVMLLALVDSYIDVRRRVKSSRRDEDDAI